MNKLASLIFLLAFTYPAISWAQYDLFPSSTTQKTEQTFENIQWQLEEIERKNKEISDKARKSAEEAQQQAELRAYELAKKTEESTEDLRYEMARSSVKAENSTFFTIILIAIIALTAYLISRKNKSSSMEENQKYGIITIFSSLFLILLTLTISEGWSAHLNYTENIMYLLKIQLIEIQTQTQNSVFGHESYYLIDIDSKYVLLIFTGIAGYGLTTYLGATPAFRPWKKLRKPQ